MLIWIYVFDVFTYIWESHLMRYVTRWNLGRERMMSSDWIVRIDIRIFFENSIYRDSSAGICLDGDTHHKQLLWCYQSWNPSQNSGTPSLQPSKEPSTKPSHAITPLTYLFVCPLLTFALRPSDICPLRSFQYWSSHFEMLRIDNSRTSLNNSLPKSTFRPQSFIIRAAETNLLPSISNHFCSDSDRPGSGDTTAKDIRKVNVASRCHWDKALPCDRFVRCCDDECFLVSAKVCL